MGLPDCISVRVPLTVTTDVATTGYISTARNRVARIFFMAFLFGI
jgi:hypothetical protein